MIDPIGDSVHSLLHGHEPTSSGRDGVWAISVVAGLPGSLPFSGKDSSVSCLAGCLATIIS